MDGILAGKSGRGKKFCERDLPNACNFLNFAYDRDYVEFTGNSEWSFGPTSEAASGSVTSALCEGMLALPRY